MGMVGSVLTQRWDTTNERLVVDRSGFFGRVFAKQEPCFGYLFAPGRRRVERKVMGSLPESKDFG
jgi:hypothetical protein